MTENTPGGECPTCGQEDNPVCSDGYHYESNTPESLEARLDKAGDYYGAKDVAEDAIAALRDALEREEEHVALVSQMQDQMVENLKTENFLQDQQEDAFQRMKARWQKAERERDEARAERDQLISLIAELSAYLHLNELQGHVWPGDPSLEKEAEWREDLEDKVQDVLDGYDPEDGGAP